MRQHIKYYFLNNITEYIKVFGFFFIGIIIAVISINKSNEFQKRELQEYIDNEIEIVKNSESKNSTEILKSSIKNNFKEFIILAFLSTTVIGLPCAYYIIIKKGFSLSYTISAIFATQNTKTAIIFICNSIVLHNIMYIMSMFIVVVSGINLIKDVIFNKKNFKNCFIKFCILLFIAFLLIIISSLIKAYISTNMMALLKKYL